jgi:hypothetical protein
MEELVRLVRKLFAYFPNSKVSELTVMNYVEAFAEAEIPLDELLVVIKQYGQVPGSFVPGSGEVIEKWRKAKGVLAQDPMDAANACIESIRRAVREVGHISAPKFKDPLTERVVKAWGWNRICEMSYDEENIAYAQMRQMYASFSRREQDEARMTPQFKQLMEQYKSKQLEKTEDDNAQASTTPTTLDIIPRRGYHPD